MAEVSRSRTARITHRLRNSSMAAKASRFFRNYLVFKNFLALSFLFLSFILLVPVLNNLRDWGKLVAVVYAFVIVALSLGLIAEFALKVFRLQLDTTIRRYSAIVTFNGVFGFIMPLFFLNVALANAMGALSSMNNYQTIFCQMRTSLVAFYRFNRVYGRIDDLIFASLLIFIALFVWGGVIEMYHRRAR